MPREIRLDSAQGIVVLQWRTGEDGLSLRVRGQSQDVRLVCGCGRSHWLVREESARGSASLVVTCHGCGTQGTFVLESVSPPRA
ncbi:MAG TPA: hypothetical protein VFA17_02365 [Thermoplasmata archaeon]|jgi:RNase P subunit RPR2|nr:hypothetical protein [Thermoplasmata archaeon]